MPRPTPESVRMRPSIANTFNVRATGIGGVLFVTGINASTGAPTSVCHTQNLAGWSCTSDRNVKRNLRPVDPESVLAKVIAMPVYHWQPKDDPTREIEHLGPMAQDFGAAFGLGTATKRSVSRMPTASRSPRSREWHRLVQQKDAQIQALQQRVASMQRQMALVESMQQRIAALEVVYDEVATLKAMLDRGATPFRPAGLPSRSDSRAPN